MLKILVISSEYKYPLFLVISIAQSKVMLLQ